MRSSPRRSFPTLPRPFNHHIVRYALVGAVGIPINNLALALFLLVTRDTYWFALPLAFEISTTCNFVLNQLYTYSEQTHIRGWGWVRRALRAQVTSSSALVVSMGVALGLKYLLHINNYLAADIGIGVAFFYNFFVSRRWVFRAADDERLDGLTNAG